MDMEVCGPQQATGSLESASDSSFLIFLHGSVAADPPIMKFLTNNARWSLVHRINNPVILYHSAMHIKKPTARNIILSTLRPAIQWVRKGGT